MNSFYNDVNDWLSVGGDLDLAKNLAGQHYYTAINQLKEQGVTHVLDVRSEWQDRDYWESGGLDPDNYLHLPIIDSHRHQPAEDWYVGVTNFVQQFWLDSVNGDRLYVHCHMGINRGPSAAMLALLTVDPTLAPMDAFLTIREARPVAGLVYAEAVGIWHLRNIESIGLAHDDNLPETISQFSAAINDYWTPDRIKKVNRGIAYYRGHEGGTLEVKI